MCCCDRMGKEGRDEIPPNELEPLISRQLAGIDAEIEIPRVAPNSLLEKVAAHGCTPLER